MYKWWTKESVIHSCEILLLLTLWIGKKPLRSDGPKSRWKQKHGTPFWPWDLSERHIVHSTFWHLVQREQCGYMTCIHAFFSFNLYRFFVNFTLCILFPPIFWSSGSAFRPCNFPDKTKQNLKEKWKTKQSEINQRIKVEAIMLPIESHYPPFSPSIYICHDHKSHLKLLPMLHHL